MNEAHIHLVTNHLPIIIPIIGLFVLVGGVILRSDIVKRTALAIFIAGAFTTAPAYFSGEGAEEMVEHIQGVEEHYIEEHEDIAKLFALLSGGLGIIAALTLWSHIKGKSFANNLIFAVLGYTIIVLYFAQQAGTTGGEIRHPEIRKGYTPAHSDESDHSH